MSRKLLSICLVAFSVGGAASAEAPRVAADIAPVHSLVARVMEGVGTPDLIVQPGASPHEYSLRPSEAAALQGADLVFWVGSDLTPWLEGAIGSLTADAAVTELLGLDGTEVLDLREGVLFEGHNHGHEGDHEEHAEGHGHDDHDHGEDHAHDHGDDHGHAHGSQDPHAWLSPANARVWLTSIAAALSAADPANAATYFTNATAGQDELDRLSEEVAALLDPVRGRNFIVFHDGYQYFEVAFDMPAAGSIALSDASAPGPARIAEIQGRIAEEGITCVLAEPQFNPGLVATVLDGTEANTGILDPLGSDLEPGPALYPDLIRNLGRALAECL